MPLDLFMALAGFAAATAWTPGPNNMMLLASGVNFGVARTLPHILGVNFGFPLMILLVGLGIGGLLTASPLAYAALKTVGIAYTLYLAWRIANSGPMKKDPAAALRPMRFHEAMLFQWVNPKAWTMALTGVAAYTLPTSYLSTLLILCATFLIVNLPGRLAWTSFGVGLRNLLHDPVRVRAFNIVMAALLVASLIPVVIEG